MKEYKDRLLSVAVAGLLFLLTAACTNEQTLLEPAAFSDRRPVRDGFNFTEQLDRNSAEDEDSRVITVAYASDQNPNIPQPPFPVLYLLHDFQGDANYYERYALQALLNEMYDEGEIGRMLVVTVDATNYFDGSFYRNSTTTGNYENVLDETIEYIERTYRIHSRAGRDARAISGHGMGGYGAFRFALDHPELFGAISATSAPLSFGDPAEGTGIFTPTIGIVDRILDDNGTFLGDPQMYQKLVAGINDYDTRMFFAMSSAFSPHPLRVFDSLGIKLVRRFGQRGFDTIYNHEYFSPRSAGANTVSFVSLVDTFGVGVDVIYNADGTLNDAIWSLWRDSADVKTVFERKRQSNSELWNDIALYIDVGTDNELGYLEQTQNFRAALTGAGLNPTYEEFERSGTIAANHSDQLIARLRRLLIFHSDHFAQPGESSQP